jgi:hypothetical protein
MSRGEPLITRPITLRDRRVTAWSYCQEKEMKQSNHQAHNERELPVFRSGSTRDSWSTNRQAVFTAKCGGGVRRHQSISLLLTECRYGDGSLDVCKTGNLRSGSFELGQGHGLLTAKLSDERSPNRFEIVEPPTRRDITSCTPHGRYRR